MKKKLLIALGVVAGSLAIGTGSASANNDCNWGKLTADTIAGGFDQGEHASSFAGTRRVGLANVIDQGDLKATCEFIRDFE